MFKNWYCRRYTVRGIGSFPHDMLRRDHARPATPEDQRLIHIADQLHREPLEIMLEMRGRRPTTTEGVHPNIERWESFGWTVTQVYPGERREMSESAPMPDGQEENPVPLWPDIADAYRLGGILARSIVTIAGVCHA